jgi:hypothetical protein
MADKCEKTTKELRGEALNKLKNAYALILEVMESLPPKTRGMFSLMGLMLCMEAIVDDVWKAYPAEGKENG